MYKQSDAALAAWRATERTLDGKVTITDGSGNETDYATSDITSIAYDSGAWTGDTFSIGSTYENNITVTFAHLVEGLKQGYKVTAKIGIKLPDGTYEYCPLGVFIISDEITMDRNNDATTIKAYDQFCVMQGTYTSKLTYPAKITDVIAEIANMSGVELNTDDIAELPTQTDLTSAISGQTYCTAIGWIAQFYGGFALFDRDGKLTIRTVTDASYILDASQYEQSGLTKNEATYQIGGMSVSVTTSTTDSTGESSETTSTLTAGETTGSQIELTNNVMTQTRLDSIWSTIKDITFYPYSLTWFGNPAVEAGDWLTLKDTKGNSFNVPNNSYTMTFDGGLTATSKADQTSTSSSSYSYSGTLSQTVKQLAGRIGATGNYIYGTDTTQEPNTAKIGDQWYKQNGNKVELWQYVRQSDGSGKWTLIVSDLTGEDIKTSVEEAQEDATTATTNANNAVTTADNALSSAQTAVANAQTASDTANDATTVANNAISQAISASSVANSVSEEVTTLKGGSTATIAELEDGLALKLSTSDFDTQIANYATKTWTTNQITATATSLSSTIASVQTQVNNSAVGTNLLLGTSGTLQTVTNATIWNEGMPTYNFYTGSAITSDTTMTLRGWISPTAHDMTVQLAWKDSSGNQHFGGGSTISAGSSGYSTWTGVVPAGSIIQYATIVFVARQSDSTTVYYKEMKLGKGSVATDWCPNPADNATVTSVSNLTQTVNSLSTTVSGKVDTTTYTSKMTQLDNAISTKVESSDYNSKMTQLDNAISTKVESTTYNTEITQLTNMVNSKVSQTDFNNLKVGGENYLLGTQDWNTSYWGYSNPAITSVDGYSLIIDATSIASNSNAQVSQTSKYVFPSSQYTLSWNLDWMSGSGGLTLYCVEYQSDAKTTTSTDTNHAYSIPNNPYRNSITFTTQPDCSYIWVVVRVFGTFKAKIEKMMLTDGNMNTSWHLNSSEIANYSQIQQLSDNINLRVVKNDVINQINISTEGILIAGNKIHITGSTTIDNAVIKSAMIDSISADKITAGTLNAANVNVINLNANNISSGTLSGDYISGGTITGVSFHQSSSGHDTWIDGNGIHNYNNSGGGVWIRNGMLEADGGTNGNAYISGDFGNLAFVSPDKHTLSVSEISGVGYYTGYDSVSNQGSGTMIANISLANDATTLPTIVQSLYGIQIIDKSYGSSIDMSISGLHLSSSDSLAVDVFGKGMYVYTDFYVSGSKNAIVQTSAGWAKINAYETAEYYFGDIGETETGSGNSVEITMDSLFLETVNTSVGYQVFITPYSDVKIWVDERNSDNFVVKSDTANAKFAYEIKAKRKGYENTRLEIDEDF